MANNIASMNVVKVVTGVEGALDGNLLGYEVMFEEAHTRELRLALVKANYRKEMAELGFVIPNPTKVTKAKKKTRQHTKSRLKRFKETAALLRREERKARRKLQKSALAALKLDEKHIRQRLQSPEVKGTQWESVVLQDLAENMAEQARLTAPKA
jgi:hypothetical protein